jgi:hypothetical protein
MEPAAALPGPSRPPPRPEAPLAGRWLGMWIAPRATMRRVLDAGPGASTWVLAALLGVSQALDQAANHDTGATHGLAMAGSALWGAVTSVLAVAEAHRIAAWRAFVATLLAIVFLAVAVGAPVALLGILASRLAGG